MGPTVIWLATEGRGEPPRGRLRVTPAGTERQKSETWVALRRLCIERRTKTFKLQQGAQVAGREFATELPRLFAPLPLRFFLRAFKLLLLTVYISRLVLTLESRSRRV